MQIPFTIEQFLATFASYNESIWPVQIIGYVVAIIAIMLLIKNHKWSDKFVLTFLTTFWIFTGLIYHIVFFSNINRAAYIFGVLFLIEAVILFVSGIIKKNISFHFGSRWWNLLGYLFITYAMIIYPISAYFLGHHYPNSPTFPLTPCPLIIFTFGILLQMKEKTSWYVWLIPFAWSLIGFSAALKLTMTEDFGLLVAGLAGTVTFLWKGRRYSFQN